MEAELAAETGLLEAAERRRRAHGAVGVDRQDAGLERPGDAEGAGSVPRPDRAREPVGRVVGDADRVGLVGERDHGGYGAEDLLARNPVLVRRLDEPAGEPEAPAVRGVAAEERLAVDERRRRLAGLG